MALEALWTEPRKARFLLPHGGPVSWKHADESASLTNPVVSDHIYIALFPPIKVGGAAVTSPFMARWYMSTKALGTSVFAEEELLESTLVRRIGNRVRDLRVLFLPDGLILQGRCATYHAKQLAQHAAMEISVVRIVSNDIEVC